MKTWLDKTIVALLLAVFHSLALAEDIDLFIGRPPSPSELPNVLIILDNTANWNQPFTNEIAALRTVVSNLPVNADGSPKFRLGFMLFTESGGGNSGNDGAYVRAAVRDLTTSYKTALVNLLNSLDKQNDKSNGGKLGITMAEAYYYFMGVVPYSGNNKVKTDYAGNTFGTAQSKAVYAFPRNALDSIGDTSYTSARPDSSCAKNFIIYISNGPAQDNSSDTTIATNLLKAAAGGDSAGDKAAATITLSPSGSQSNVADEWARFLKKSSLGVVTYTIDVNKDTTGQGPGWSKLLESMAVPNGGRYYDVSSGELGAAILKAMEEIFTEIQSVNSSFASVSLPVSQNIRGSFKNQVYIGMFTPDAEANPRWDGNLKQYKVGLLDGEPKLIDADNKIAVNNLTEFIAECARSYWTPNATDSYWNFRPSGECSTIANSAISNFPDGNAVAKGAQAFKLRGNTGRVLRTCSSNFASCTSLTNFNNTTVSPSDLGVTTTAERDTLVSWARGLNVDNEGNKGTTVMRPSVHGDVIHSQPVAIDFSTDPAAPKTVVFYGGNDGILRAINGNQTESIGTVAPGEELWSFMAPEFFKQIKRVRENTIKISFPNHGITTHTPLPKPYGFDGTIRAYRNADSTMLVAPMRRGGRAVYAFNINPANPADITLRWKIGCPNLTNDDNCMSEFSGIGQTWSTPIIFKAAGYGSGTTPLMIMGGGYDSCEDADVASCTATSKGRYVYVFEANTGNWVATLPTERGVIADVFVINNKSTGAATHAYVVDLGGNVYRIDIGNSAPNAWTPRKIASLGCDSGQTCTSNRKFMFTPSVVQEDFGYTLLLGSGDREKPLNSATYPATMSVENHFFMIKDNVLDATWLTSETANCGGPYLCKASLYPITTEATPTSAALATKKGWYLGLNRETSGGLAATEQVVTAAVTAFNVVTFRTHLPSLPEVGSCTPDLGKSRVCNINYTNAKGAHENSVRCIESEGGLSGNPTIYLISKDGLVELGNNEGVGSGNHVSSGNSDDLIPVCFGCGKSALDPEIPLGLNISKQPKSRVYWYIQK